jgi:hypothetical protein
MDERQIAAVLKKEKAVDPNRPTYTRMSRRHLSIETLSRYRIDYEFDVVSNSQSNADTTTNKIQDPEYVLIKRWVPGQYSSSLENRRMFCRPPKS